ncbi:MAG: dihydrodipicolinate synthase family protein [Pseudorhodobacter sp.]
MSSSIIAESPSPSAPRSHLFGVSVAMVTPFARDDTVDLARLAVHAAAVQEAGVDGITLFGTTGEGASLGLAERGRMLDASLDAGVPAGHITVGIAACDAEGAEAQARLALRRGIRSLLLAPPFYFKGIDDDALLDWVTAFVARVADADPRIILYHIPQVTGVGFSASLVRRIKERCGDVIFGIKDSEGSWSHAEAFLPMKDLAVLIGDERLLARAAPLGGAGAISGMANLLPGVIADLIHHGRPNAELNRLVDDVVSVPVTPLVKALVGETRGDNGWARTRPPLSPANPNVVKALAARVAALMG